MTPEGSWVLESYLGAYSDKDTQAQGLGIIDRVQHQFYLSELLESREGFKEFVLNSLKRGAITRANTGAQPEPLEDFQGPNGEIITDPYLVMNKKLEYWMNKWGPQSKHHPAPFEPQWVRKVRSQAIEGWDLDYHDWE
eukprot:519084-Pyramimonas_sp.AAC.1